MANPLHGVERWAQLCPRSPPEIRGNPLHGVERVGGLVSGFASFSLESITWS